MVTRMVKGLIPIDVVISMGTVLACNVYFSYCDTQHITDLLQSFVAVGNIDMQLLIVIQYMLFVG